jgi:hypothetical protein
MKTILKLTLIATILISLSGCDQFRQTISDTLSPPSPNEIAARVDNLVDQEKPEKAIEIGEKYLKEKGDDNNVVREAITRAKIFLESHGSSESSSKESSSTSSGNKQSSSKNSEKNAVSVDGASVEDGPDGTVVRAGDAVVIMKKNN